MLFLNTASLVVNCIGVGLCIRTDSPKAFVASLVLVELGTAKGLRFYPDWKLISKPAVESYTHTD